MFYIVVRVAKYELAFGNVPLDPMANAVASASPDCLRMGCLRGGGQTCT